MRVNVFNKALYEWILGCIKDEVCFVVVVVSSFFPSPQLLTTLSFENESFPTG